MATYLWSSLTDGQTIAFNPTVDVLHIDDPTKSAADIYALVVSMDLSHFSLNDFGLNRDQDKTVTLQVDPRMVTQTNITFADGSVLLIGDNTTGTINDDSANTLVGGIHDDQLLGLGGADSLTGGGGDDSLGGGLGNDTIVGGDGNDILSDTDFAFDSNYQLVGGGDDSLVGGAGSDFFIDFSGNNVLDGGDGGDFFLVYAFSGGSRATGGLGQDAYILSGYTDLYGPTYYEALDFQAGAGGDWLYIGGLLWLSAENGFYQAGDPFTQGLIRLAQSGADTLVQFDEDGAAGVASTWKTQLTLKNVTASSITADNITGLITGGDGDDNLVGGANQDAIFAGNGRDTLDGGAGADSMRGGAGADFYYVDDRDDLVAETSNALSLAAAGLPPDLATALDDTIDTVIAAVTYSLENVAFVENLTLAAGSVASAGTGNPLANVLTGNELNNTFRGLAGNDTLDGGGGVDTAAYSNARAGYTVTKTASGHTVSGSEGNDTLSNIERLQFSDKSLAFDMTMGEAGGKTALLLGACLGANGLSNQATVGAILGYFDGGYTLTDAATALVDAGIVAQLAGGADNKHFVDWMALNLVDALPDASTEAVLIDFITSGQFTQATFLATLAAHQINQDHIGLTGLQQNGMEYL